MRSLCLSLVCLIVLPVTAQDLPWTPGTGSLGDWEQVDHGIMGSWSVSRGVIMQNNQSAWNSEEGAWTALIGGNPEWSDLTLRATLKIHGEGEDDTVGLIFGWQDEENHWRVRLERSWTGGESYRVLERVVSGEVHEVARVEGMSERDQVELTVAQHLRMYSEGSPSQVFILENERTLFQLGEHEAICPEPGHVGLLSTGKGFTSFRQVNVTAERVPGITMALDRSLFRTAPADPSTPFRLGVWGDNRTDVEAHRRVATALASEEPDVAVNVGDVVTNGRNPHEWREEFFEPAARLLQITPTYIAIGNHERDDDLFYELFEFPGRENWYAVTHGSMRMVVLDTNQPVRPNSPQHDWLLEEIESDEFQSAAWHIAAFHHPPFSEGWDNPDYDGEPAVRRHLWPVLRDAEFDLLLMGHTHDYERGTLDGVVHVITGGGGSALDHRVQNWDFIDVYESAYQYCILDISPERIAFQAKTPEGRVIDEFELTR